MKFYNILWLTVLAQVDNELGEDEPGSEMGDMESLEEQPVFDMGGMEG